MKKILCDAVPFCFGPISKLLTISEELKDFADLTLLASGTTKELGKNGPYKKIIDCNTENIKDLEKNKKLFQEYDLFLTVMNPIATKFAKSMNVPTAQIDSLFWMWEDISKEMGESELYFIQEFDGVKKQINKLKNKIKNPIIVGPIIMKKPKIRGKKNQLIVNFGGIESSLIKIGKNSNYPFTVSKILLKIFEKQNKFDSILFVGLEKIMKKLEKQNTNKKIKFKSLEHKEFLKEFAIEKSICKIQNKFS